MRSTVTCAVPARLEAGRRQFEHWRRTRARRGRIPDRLWNVAVRLSAAYGIHRTAQVLRLNADSLKQHVASAGDQEAFADGSGAPCREPAASFVELLPTGPSRSPECVVELEDPRGVKMRIHLAGHQSSDVVTAVSKVLFRAEP